MKKMSTENAADRQRARMVMILTRAVKECLGQMLGYRWRSEWEGDIWVKIRNFLPQFLSRYLINVLKKKITSSFQTRKGAEVNVVNLKASN